MLLWRGGKVDAQSSPPVTTGSTGIVRYNASLRAGPGSTYSIVGHVQAGDRVAVTATSNDGVWLQLANGDWLATVLVEQPRPVATAAQSTTTPTPTRQRLLIATATTALTTTNSLTATLLDAAPFTTTFNAVLAPTLTATGVSSRSLGTTNATILLPTVQPTRRTGASALRNANLRRGPGLIYAIVGGVRAADPLDVQAQAGDGAWLQLRDGSWIAAFLVDQAPAAIPTVAAAVIAALPTVESTATATPPPPAVTSDAVPVDTAATPTPQNRTQPPGSGNTTFVLTRRRLWNTWENGGSMDGPSVHCGQGRNLTVNVLDENGNRLDGVAVQAQYGAKEIYVTGAQGKGDGVAEFVLGSGQDVKVVRDNDGSPVESEVAVGLSTDPRGIDQESLLNAGYCQDDESCRTFVNNLGCIGHFSWTVTFERRR